MRGVLVIRKPPYPNNQSPQAMKKYEEQMVIYKEKLRRIKELRKILSKEDLKLIYEYMH